MITDFYSKGEDSELPNTRGSGWRIYPDNDKTDTRADPSNRDSNKGMFNNSYEVYSDLVEAMKAVNERRYSLMEFFLSEP